MKKIWQIKTDTSWRANWAPFLEAKEALMNNGSKSWKPEMRTFFSHVATIDVDTAEQAFELTNLWNDDSKVIWKDKCHSLSVGDVVEFEDGVWFMVDPFGFSEV
jgi:hypothetical protein